MVCLSMVPCTGYLVTPRFDSEDVKLIASFNLGTEKYQLDPQPEYSEKNFHMNVLELGGSLCVLCNYLSYIDIWVMNDSGVKDSWIKLTPLHNLMIFVALSI